MKNVGGVDRALRVIAGLVLLYLAVTGRTAWGWLGLVPLLTALVGFCPLYRLLGLNTCPLRD